MKEKKENIWIPREIKQKEVIIFHVPVIKRPVTSRHLFYLIPGLFLGVLFLVLSFVIAPIKLDIEGNTGTQIAQSIVIRSIIAIAIPIFLTMLSKSKKNGKYLEERLMLSIKHKKNSDILLNEKALRGIERRKDHV